MGKIAFLFTGQGAQYSGMGRTLYESHPKATEIFDFLEGMRFGLKELCFISSKEKLTKTINTQPALFAVSLACAEVLRSEGIVPDAVAGFSLGEIPALAFTNILSTKDAFELVLERSKLMEQCNAKIDGAMVAIMNLSVDEVEKICFSISGCYPVNYNSPNQTVAACLAKDANTVIRSVKESGGRAIRLRVSGAFHSPYMDNAAKGLQLFLEKIQLNTSNIPLYSNVNSTPYETGQYKKSIASQVNSPVLWRQSLENMFDDGITRFIEVGAGNILSSLVKATLPKAQVISFGSIEELDAVKEFCLC